MAVRRTGHVKIVDFGIAYGSTMSRLTNTGSAIGTLAYMAPERFGAGDVDGRADLYALGCVLFELLTGSLPYPAADTVQLVAAHLHGTPTPLRTVRPDAPATLESLALRVADRVLESGEPEELEPMTAVERKVVHLRLKDVPGVGTTSEGTEPNRYVVVVPE